MLTILFLVFSTVAQAGATFANASGNYLNCGSNSNLDNLTAKTISFWFRKTNTTDAAPVAKDAATGWNVLFSSTFIRFYHRTSGTRVQRDSNTAVTTNTWQHFAITHDGSLTATNILLYLDGTNVSGATQNGTGTLNNDSANNVTFGGNAALDAIDGTLDEIAIWNVQLTVAEISRLKMRSRRMPLQIRPANLVLYAPLDEAAQGVTATGTGLYRDRSAAGNHCTPTNSPVGAGSILSYGGGIN